LSRVRSGAEVRRRSEGHCNVERRRVARARTAVLGESDAESDVDLQRRQLAGRQALQVDHHRRYDVTDDVQGRSQGRRKLQGHAGERQRTGFVHRQTHCARYAVENVSLCRFPVEFGARISSVINNVNDGLADILCSAVFREEGLCCSTPSVITVIYNSSHVVPGHYILQLWFLSFFFLLLSFFLSYSQRTNAGLNSEMCCMRLAENTGRKNR